MKEDRVPLNARQTAKSQISLRMAQADLRLCCLYKQLLFTNIPLIILMPVMRSLIIILAVPCENVSSGICGQRRPGSACASAQSDQGLCCPLTESLDTVECINGEQMPGWDFVHARDESVHFAHALRHIFAWRGSISLLLIPTESIGWVSLVKNTSKQIHARFGLLLTLSMLGKIQQTTNWWYFSYFSWKLGFVISCKLSPKEETICMKCQTFFVGKIRKIFQNVVCWEFHPICKVLTLIMLDKKKSAYEI